ncbi:MAG: adenosylmethionine--8-amino-7-oxononanoate transaminase [Magnetococcales bacterium]|nr:adenosylmethionine--8-amino-7-oxononanoate transaminase [Magnetococcales bacterium]
MSRHDTLVSLDRRHVWHPYTQEKTAPDPVPILSGKGATLFGADGHTYTDLVSSWWVTNHGHSHPVIAKAIADQANTLEQVIFAGFTHEPAVTLSARLSERLPGDLSRVFFSDDGSTAVEVGLKMAIQRGINQGEKRTRFLTFEGGYHGDTVGAMSAGRASGFFDAFGTMLFQVDALPFPETWDDDPDVEAKEAKSLSLLSDYLDRHGKECAAMLIEPLIQGASGMRICRPEFLKKMDEMLKGTGVLTIYDEVMTGFGRTGTLFACEQADVVPDVICLSKGLTGGFMPMSVTVCTQEVYNAFLGDAFDQALAHGHSFTANPLGCAAALASLELYETEKTLDRIAAIARIHRERLDDLKSRSNAHHFRALGSIAALDMRTDSTGYTSSVGPKLKAFFMERGLLIRPLGHVIYLLPPYCVSADELHMGWDAIGDALASIS